MGEVAPGERHVRMVTQIVGKGSETKENEILFQLSLLLLSIVIQALSQYSLFLLIHLLALALLLCTGSVCLSLDCRWVKL